MNGRLVDARREVRPAALSRMTIHPRPFTVYRLLFTLSFSLACSGTLPPLRGKIDVGREPYAIFVGGKPPAGDLYAVRANGGPAVPITFTPVAELMPALHPSGTQVAFLRGESLHDATPTTMWVMNLLNGAERELQLPKDAGRPRRIGWTPDGESLVLRTGRGVYRLNAPPAEPDPQPVARAERAAAESSLAVLLGDPIFASVVSCRSGTYLCVVNRRGKPGILAQAARDPVRWGPDSVAFFVGPLLQIRPLRRGRPRLMLWSNVPEKPRQITFFEGTSEK